MEGRWWKVENDWMTGMKCREASDRFMSTLCVNIYFSIMCDLFWCWHWHKGGHGTYIHDSDSAQWPRHWTLSNLFRKWPWLSSLTSVVQPSTGLMFRRLVRELEGIPVFLARLLDTILAQTVSTANTARGSSSNENMEINWEERKIIKELSKIN